MSSLTTIENITKIGLKHNQNNNKYKKEKAKRTIKEELKIKFYQNRFLIFGVISTISQIWFIKNGYIINAELFKENNKVYDEIAFVSTIQLQDPEVSSNENAEGELKETDKIEKQIKEDPRIASAKNVFMIGATIPVDLTPDIKPEYPQEARIKGIEGTVTLEVVIADTGEVLKVTAINKPLGYGLEQSAISAFKKKRYQPAIYEGKPITVKVLVPVQFRLN
ncbi:MAG: cell envelope biogenesis protein TonB [Leptospiraceae bacterium]|nr:MAG: cell envelope biogenesis protein TonB [Leptospiraceae bacterium]